MQRLLNDKSKYDLSFYRRIVQKIENDATVEVKDVVCGDACKKGNNFICKVQRCKVKYRKGGTDCEMSVIVKTLMDSALVKRFKFDVVFRNEHVAYTEILPALARHSTQKLSIPNCLYASEEIIVLQDISALGYKNLEKGQRFTLEHTEMVLEQLAKLHAASLNFQEKQPELAKKLRILVADIYKREEGAPMKEVVDQQINLCVKVFKTLSNNTQTQETIAKLNNIRNTAYEAICSLFSNDRKLSVFNHGDTWGNNIMFKDCVANLIDFQMMRHTSVAADLCYFLYINTDVSLRKKHLNSLLVKYLEYLKRYCRENAVSDTLIGELELGWLKREMEDYAIFGFLSGLMILPVFHLEGDDLDFDSNLTNDVLIDKMSDGYKTSLIERVVEFIDHTRNIK